MAVSQHSVTFLLAAVISAMILTGFNFFDTQKELRGESIDLTAERLQEDINMVSGFPQGSYIQVELGVEYGFNTVEDGDKFELHFQDETVEKQLEVDVDDSEFKSDTFCLQNTGEAVSIQGGEGDGC